MREMLWSLRVSELAPARSHADVACEGMRTVGACGSCSVVHTDTQSTESEAESRERRSLCAPTSGMLSV